jgi:hypothetical protein
MAWGGNVCPTQFKVDLLKGIHDFTPSTGDAYKMVLYDNTVTPAASATAYAGAGSESGELATAGGYTQGGAALTTTATYPKADGTSGIVDFGDPQWTTATFDAYGCSIYNDTDSDKYVGFFDFGGKKSVTNGTFTVVMPAAAAGTAIIEIS